MEKESQYSKKILVSILITSTFLGGLGQFLFKIGLNNHNSFILLLFVFLGFLSYSLSTVFYFFALSRAHLSWVYGFGGLSYIFASLLASFIEPVPLLRWLGIFIIAVGTALIGIS